MAEPLSQEVTRLLIAWRQGEPAALDELVPLVYDELRRIAAHYLRGERRGHTLQTSALVNEAFLRLIDQTVDWRNRAQFFGIASKTMRRILVDHGRRRSAEKRGHATPHLDIDAAESQSAALETDVDFEAIDQALRKLEAMDDAQGRVVELRFFGGLSIEETAEVVGVSTATIKREWALARAWLHRELGTGA